jgi:hypothetical protein
MLFESMIPTMQIDVEKINENEARARKGSVLKSHSHYDTSYIFISFKIRVNI